MLSRIAESLFWIGRYVERADDTARILDVHTQRLVEDPWIDEQRACHNLLALMGVTCPLEEADTERVLATLAFDRVAPSSIVGALSAARENARGAREVLATSREDRPRGLDFLARRGFAEHMRYFASVLTLALTSCAGDEGDVGGGGDDDGGNGGDAAIESVDSITIGLVPATDSATEAEEENA